MKSGFPPCAITVAQRLRYYQALEAWHTSGQQTAFFDLVAEAVEASFQLYWHALNISP